MVLTSGARIKLADISIVNDEVNNKTVVYLKNELKIESRKIYLDFDSKNETVATDEFVSIIYFFNEGLRLYININKLIVNNTEAIISNYDNDFNPYLWEIEIPQSSVKENSIVNSDFFNQNRLALLSTYSSETLTHGTLLVTFSVGLITAYFSLYSRGVKNKKRLQRVLLLLIFTIAISLIFYIIVRLVFWSWLSSSVLGVLPNEAINDKTTTPVLGMQTYLTEYFRRNNGLGFVLDIFPAIILFSPIGLVISFIGCNLLMDLDFGKITCMDNRRNKRILYIGIGLTASIFFALIILSQVLKTSSFMYILFLVDSMCLFFLGVFLPKYLKKDISSVLLV